jgi:hypothetical protein
MKIKKLPPAVRKAASIFTLWSGFYRFDDHILEQNLKRHGMAAAFMGNEKLAIAIKNTLIVRNMVFAIVTVEIKVKLVEVKAVSILSVTLCLFDLADQSRIHCSSLLFCGNIKNTRGHIRVYLVNMPGNFHEKIAYRHYL